MRTDLPVVLEKVKSNHDMLSRDVYTGWAFGKPHVGEQFNMETREEGKLWTTAIKTVRFISENQVEFDTKNSTYRLTYVKDDYLGEEVYLDEIESAILTVFVARNISSMTSVIGTLKTLSNKLSRSTPNA